MSANLCDLSPAAAACFAGLSMLSLGASPPCSTAPLDRLLGGEDMQEAFQRQQQAICKPLHELKRVPFYGEALLVEDTSGRIEYLCIYNSDDKPCGATTCFASHLRIGEILAIKEPLTKVHPQTSSALVFVGPLKCIESLSPNNANLRSVAWSTHDPAKSLPLDFDYKALGNSLFKQKKYTLAAMAYGDGLRDSLVPAEQKPLLRLNRAQAQLNLGNYASAYRDASTVLDLFGADTASSSPMRLKAKVRLARAFEGMRLLSRAKEAYTAVLEVDSSSVEGKDGENRVDKMLHEAQTGEYDWDEFEAAAFGGSKLDIGDFVGPVEVLQLAGRGGGRGIVATRDVNAGEVLLVEKAFAVAFPDPDRIVLDYKLSNACADPVAEHPLACTTAARVRDDPSTAPLVHSLSGKFYPAAGTFPLGSLGQREVQDEECSVEVDIVRIASIATQNRFTSGLESAPNDWWSFQLSTLFLSASLLNHSCWPNADWLPFGDAIVIRARTSIRQGDEVMVSYCNAEKPCQLRLETLSVHFSNGCTCPLCDLDRIDGADNLRRREQLLDVRLPALGKSGGGKLGRKSAQQKQRDLLALVADLNKTYDSSRGMPKPELVLPLILLGEIEFALHPESPATANAYTLEALRAGGAVIEDEGARVEVVAAPFAHQGRLQYAVVAMAGRFAIEGEGRNEDLASRWVKAAMSLARIVDGDSVEQFKRRYEGVLGKFGLEEIIERIAMEPAEDA
ncbi:hypothetical protein JCM8097_001537 [Rhodosporidiobolus ruineniae]